MPVIIHIILIVNILIIHKTIGISIKVNPVSISIRSNYKGMSIGVAVNSSGLVGIGKLFLGKSAGVCDCSITASIT